MSDKLSIGSVKFSKNKANRLDPLYTTIKPLRASKKIKAKDHIKSIATSKIKGTSTYTDEKEPVKELGQLKNQSVLLPPNNCETSPAKARDHWQYSLHNNQLTKQRQEKSIYISINLEHKWATYLM